MGLVGTARDGLGALGRGWWVGGGGIVGRQIKGAYPNRPPRPRFLLDWSRMAGSRLSRQDSKKSEQAADCLGVWSPAASDQTPFQTETLPLYEVVGEVKITILCDAIENILTICSSEDTSKMLP